ncbi:LOW QUALITY PROTEIN: uncharacterized protein LOC108089756 [Drosophila ficusphila]|uniref:LOW QUALITY PROTEIN: uncharacterized protein LOC108089756 n=1 Tax=Drosophila ficusphila TaxID=30025 RepID=UPI0007E7192B|nr:LOW QUALITY PROTEIN: uncharacterized protein LOC108089756 [Drosophila ficusphila]
MFPDDLDLEPFNPFNVGPPNSGARSEFKIPTCVTYPPPVFLAKPEYLKSAEGGSKASLYRDGKPKLDQSKSGEVAISKAINEEMAVAKKQAAAIHEKDRIDAGGVSKVKLAEESRSQDAVSKGSLRTLMPVKSNRQSSGEGKNNSSKSELSVASKESSASKSSRASIATKASKISQAASVVSNTSSSNASLTPKSILKPTKSIEAAKASSTTIKSKVSETASKISTKSSVNSKTKVADSKRSLKQQKSDSISQRSVKSKTSDAETLGSKKEDAKEETSSKKGKEDPTSDKIRSITYNSKVLPESKDGPSYIQSESALSYRQSLKEQAAEMADRLNAGNENFRRYDSVVRNHSIKVPQKLSHGDRMSFWFSDAVLS